VLDLRSSPARQIPPHALADTTSAQADGYEESLSLLDKAQQGENELAGTVPATFRHPRSSV
jgi:hypothetical protein